MTWGGSVGEDERGVGRGWGLVGKGWSLFCRSITVGANWLDGVVPQGCPRFRHQLQVQGPHDCPRWIIAKTHPTQESIETTASQQKDTH